MYMSTSQRMASTYKRVDVESRVESASPHELITLLFEGLLTTLSAAKVHMTSGNIEAKSQAITKASRIITEGLKGSLDPRGGDLSSNLGLLYDYCVASLMQAHLKNDAALIDEVVGLIGPVSETWKSMNTNNTL
jgi:flagellar protein FliS